MKKLKLPICIAVFLISLALGVFSFLTMMSFVAIPFLLIAAAFFVLSIIKTVERVRETAEARREARQKKQEEKRERENGEKPGGEKKGILVKILLPAVSAVLVIALIVVLVTQCGGTMGNGIKQVQVKNLSNQIHDYYSYYLYKVEYLETGYEPWDSFFEKYQFSYAIKNARYSEGEEFKVYLRDFKNTDPFPGFSGWGNSPEIRFRVVKTVKAYCVEVDDDGTVIYYQHYTQPDVVSGEGGTLYLTKDDAMNILEKQKNTIKVSPDNITIIYE